MNMKITSKKNGSREPDHLHYDRNLLINVLPAISFNDNEWFDLMVKEINPQQMSLEILRYSENVVVKNNEPVNIRFYTIRDHKIITVLKIKGAIIGVHEKKKLNRIDLDIRFDEIEDRDRFFTIYLMNYC